MRQRGHSPPSQQLFSLPPPPSSQHRHSLHELPRVSGHPQPVQRPQRPPQQQQQQQQQQPQQPQQQQQDPWAPHPPPLPRPLPPPPQSSAARGARARTPQQRQAADPSPVFNERAQSYEPQQSPQLRAQQQVLVGSSLPVSHCASGSGEQCRSPQVGPPRAPHHCERQRTPPHRVDTGSRGSRGSRGSSHQHLRQVGDTVRVCVYVCAQVNDRCRKEEAAACWCDARTAHARTHLMRSAEDPLPEPSTGIGHMSVLRRSGSGGSGPLSSCGRDLNPVTPHVSRLRAQKEFTLSLMTHSTD
uniref:Uncharacterized protein n=1 Tax=Knipowitschia caucasica TaxID=637954 RepID=A0AAV2JU43_KNICA